MIIGTEIESRRCTEPRCDQVLAIELKAADGQHTTTTAAEFDRHGWRGDFCPAHAHLNR